MSPICTLSAAIKTILLHQETSADLNCAKAPSHLRNSSQFFPLEENISSDSFLNNPDTCEKCLKNTSLSLRQGKEQHLLIFASGLSIVGMH
jgi:hypothetical protein